MATGAQIDKFSRLAALRPARATGAGLISPARALRSPNEEDIVSRILGAGIGTNRYGEHVCIRNWCSTPEFAAPSAIAIELLARSRDDAESRGNRELIGNAENWLFLDTETTGLSGGTGTYAFLIGLAWWDGGGLQTEQFFMRDFGEEHSILHELAARLAERPVLVTFNGKTFDWPLLENRFAMTRAIRVPRLTAHLDLLHPARALWKLRLGSVRLTELERQVLEPCKVSWSRDDDLVSAQIPQHYFDYLRGGPAAPLAAVVRHNQMDLRGLAALFEKIDQLLSSQSGLRGEVHGLDLFGLARFLQRRGDRDSARAACSDAIDAGLPLEFRPRARRELAALAKRSGKHEEAAAIWLEMARAAGACDEDAAHACEQLAIYYERRAKDFARAAEFARLAVAKLRRLRSASRCAKKGRAATAEQSLVMRLKRLENRERRSREDARLGGGLPLIT